MKPTSLQQALAGLAVALVIAATLLGGLILALGDMARERNIAEVSTPTPFQITTLPPLVPSVTKPTAGPTRTPETPTVIIPTEQRRPSPTPTATQPTPTRTRTPIPTWTRTPTPQPCAIPVGWVRYTVQSGDNLFRIGLRYGLTVDRLAAANCLSNRSRVMAGDVLYVPPTTPMNPTSRPTGTQAAVTPSVNPNPLPTGTQTATDGACTNPDSVITAPRVGAVLRGRVELRGTAQVPDFAFYKLEIRREGASTAANYVTFHTGTQQVSNGVLVVLDTTNFTDGEFWIRLVVVNSTGNYPERCAILYMFDN